MASILSHRRGPFGLVSSFIGWGAAEGLTAESDADERPLHAGYGLNASLGLLAVAFAANASRNGNAWAIDIFYVGVAWLFLPLAYVAARRDASPRQRFAAVMLATVALYAVRFIREPVAFIDHDEFLHWTTANHILDSGRLFSPNALLPVSPLYPGLETVATAIVSLSGMTMFQVATCLLAACRLGFVAALFLAYRRLSGSARVAACGSLVYMGSSTFLVFDTQFSYESLAVLFVAAVILADARSRDVRRTSHVVFVIVPLLAALAVTHHMTAYFASAYLFGLAVLEAFRAPPRRFLVSSILVAAWAVSAPIAWSKAMGDPEAGYLGPVLASGVHEAANLLTFSTGRTLFVSENGYVAPLWQRVAALASVAIVCLGLSVGFFRALALGGLPFGRELIRRPGRLREWRNGSAILLTLLTLAYPVSMLFRLTKSGWEIGNRIGPFSFVGVGFVIAVGVVSLMQGRGVAWAGAFATAATVVLVGGIISAEGPRILVPAKFEVSSDSASISHLGIEAAKWSRRWLGERNLFAADRINRLLLSTYGRQDVASTLQDGYDTSDAVLAPTFGPRERELLRKVGLDYLAVDLRITTALPGVGGYFDGGDRDRDYRSPPLANSLLKFDTQPLVGKVFDDGYVFIYDVRALDGTR